MEDIKKNISNNTESEDMAMQDSDCCVQKEKKMVVSADNMKLYDVVAFMKADMAENNVPERKQFNLVTASEEIFSNIAYYAYEKKDNGKVTIRTFIKGDIYYIEFKDNGKKYNPLENKDPDITQELNKRKIGGLGVYMAKRLSDDIKYEYSEGFNILTIGVKYKGD